MIHYHGTRLSEQRIANLIHGTQTMHNRKTCHCLQFHNMVPKASRTIDLKIVYADKLQLTFPVKGATIATSRSVVLKARLWPTRLAS